MNNLLITNGGAHPPEKWAAATASHIVDIADHVAGEKRGAAIKLQAAIIDILEGHHTTVQNGERAKITEHGHARLSHDLDPDHHLSIDEVIAAIQMQSVGTPWDIDLNTDAAAESLRVLLNQHFKTSMHIERSWHADRNPDTEQAKAFHSIYHSGVK